MLCATALNFVGSCSASCCRRPKSCPGPENRAEGLGGATTAVVAAVEGLAGGALGMALAVADAAAEPSMLLIVTGLCLSSRRCVMFGARTDARWQRFRVIHRITGAAT